MPIIYTPSGMAREYSPYAANLYIGCSHMCKYCYAPHTLQKSAESYYGVPSPRRDVLRLLEADLRERSYDKQILLSFIGDVYCRSTDDSQTTRDALLLLRDYNAPVAVLSKGGHKMLRDTDVFELFGEHIAVGTTLTFDNAPDSREWEPGASPPEERLDTLRVLHAAGVPTFASFEPVIDPGQSLRLIERTLNDNSVDHYKIGKLNNYLGLDKGIDWRAFLIETLALLRPTGKKIYIKKCLAALAPNIPLTADESDPERWTVRA